jgi:hypothetical protein
VELVPSTHPLRGFVLSNLAQFLVTSFRHSYDQTLLSEATALHRQSLCPLAGGVYDSDRLSGLADALIAEFDAHQHLGHLHEALRLVREALECRPPGHHRRLESLQKLGNLLCRTEYQSQTEALVLYREALDICPVGSPLRAEVLSNTSTCFLDPGSPFFDLSQGVAHLAPAYSNHFCHVNRRLRSAMSDLPRVESAHTKVTEILDGSILGHFNNRVLDLYAQVSEEAEALIFKIRGYPSLDRFLMTPAYDALVEALPDGFVAVVNAFKLGYHALFLHRSRRLVSSLTLQPPQTEFDSTIFRSQLPRDMSVSALEGDTRAMRKNRGRGGSFMNVLDTLWTLIVQPIVEHLGVQVKRESPVSELALTVIF